MIKHITIVRKAVAIMANQLRKQGYSLSKAFKTAWRRVKEGMTCKAAGVTYENRQELLRFISVQPKESLKVYLRRDKGHQFDNKAVAIVVGIKGYGYAHIGYLITGLAQSFAGVIDGNIPFKANITITGGYTCKETYGALINITI